MSESYDIRAMARDEIDLAIDWAAAEGWNPGLHDADAFHAADRGGFRVGEVVERDDRTPVGCISAVTYRGRFGFIGFYIVRPDRRGKGFGIRLWQAAMQRLDGQLIGLDGVVDQQNNYRRSGFVLAHRNIRHRGEATLSYPPPGVVRLSVDDVPRVAACDAWVFPVPRIDFLTVWLSQPHVGAFGFVRDGKLTGYTVVRPCREGWKIGPLAADAEDAAEGLYRAVSDHAVRAESAVRGDAAISRPSLYLDTPEVNAAALRMVERHELEPVFETARMYTGDAPALALERMYGVTTFELG